MLSLHLFASCLPKDNIFSLYEYCSNLYNLVGRCYAISIKIITMQCMVWLMFMILKEKD